MATAIGIMPTLKFAFTGVSIKVSLFRSIFINHLTAYNGSISREEWCDTMEDAEIDVHEYVVASHSWILISLVTLRPSPLIL